MAWLKTVEPVPCATLVQPSANPAMQFKLNIELAGQSSLHAGGHAIEMAQSIPVGHCAAPMCSWLQCMVADGQFQRQRHMFGEWQLRLGNFGRHGGDLESVTVEVRVQEVGYPAVNHHCR